MYIKLSTGSVEALDEEEENQITFYLRPPNYVLTHTLPLYSNTRKLLWPIYFPLTEMINPPSLSLGNGVFG